MVRDLQQLIACRPIAELSLAPVRQRAKRFEETLGWTDAHLDAVEALYRCFLFLVWKYRDRAIVPCKEVDVFWHWHILDTRKYAEDCHAIFGRMLHHDLGVALAGKALPWDTSEAAISQPIPW